MKIHQLILILFAAAFITTACRSKDEMPYSMDPVDNIEALWKIIDTRYCYIDVKGIDW